MRDPLCVECGDNPCVHGVGSPSEQDLELSRLRTLVRELEAALADLELTHANCSDAMDEAISLETEACAKVAGEMHSQTKGHSRAECEAGEDIAAAIRARGG